MNKKLGFILFVLIFFQILMSAVILYADFGGDVACPTNGEGCDFVTGSIYGEIFGVKVAIFGLVAFVVLLGLLIYSRYNKIGLGLFTLSAVIGGLFSLYFLFIQAFVLKLFCTRCLFVDAVALLIAVLAIVGYLKHSRN